MHEIALLFAPALQKVCEHHRLTVWRNSSLLTAYCVFTCQSLSASQLKTEFVLFFNVIKAFFINIYILKKDHSLFAHCFVVLC